MSVAVLDALPASASVFVWLWLRLAEGHVDAVVARHRRAAQVLAELAALDLSATPPASRGCGLLGHATSPVSAPARSAGRVSPATRTASWRRSRPTSFPSEVVIGEVSRSCSTMK